MQTSVDGCIAGPDNEINWLVGDDKSLKCIHEIAESLDIIIIIGRKMVDEFISYWKDDMNKPDYPIYAFAKKMIEVPKVVFTKALKIGVGEYRTYKRGPQRRNYQVKIPKRK